VKRREFIGLVGGAAAWPLTASAQRSGGKIVTIGILAIEPWPPIDTFRHALNDLGYIEGKNVRFEYRYAKGHNEQLPELANDLVGLNVDVIVTWGTDAVLAAKQATTTIPIVMGTIGDPLLDLGWMLATWPDAADPTDLFGSEIASAGGLPSPSDLIARYADYSEREVSAVPWYVVLACFKLGILLEGTYARACAGKAPMAVGERLHGLTLRLFDRARASIAGF